ncbi:MAG: helix-turn-helix transcriptional regulator [Synergistaceae bacterium]|nr:helix-turn-helix transcriptional regulator [Synergistaceae bacterium]
MGIFNERLKSARKGKNISRAQLAESLCVTPATVTRWENGDREPDFATAKRIASALETTVAFLLGETERSLPATAGPSAPDDELLRLFHTLGGDERAEVLQFIRFKKFLASNKGEL